MSKINEVNIKMPEGETEMQTMPYVVNNALNKEVSINQREIQLNMCNGPQIATPLKKVSNNKNGHFKKPTITLSHLPKRPPVDIQFNDLSYSVSQSGGYKTILKGVSGKFKSGDLTAIMGPSGAGKSTLMNILAGYKSGNLHGTILINGKERNLRRFRKMSCYIMQDDCLSPHLTVKEAMMVSANLKMGKNLTQNEKKIVIREVLEALNLQESQKTFATLLSGGQRKRLSIALELVNNPPVMFFDEPTSGLDSSSCFQCLTLLKSLAAGGRTIICTIHQPSARLFEMFDYLYLLTDGQCIYNGVIPGLVPFLSIMGLDCPSYHNPADYVMEVACGEHGDYVQKLVVAVNAGVCNNTLPQLTANYKEETGRIITNDIIKETKPITEKEQISLNESSKPNVTTSLLDSSETLAYDKENFTTSGFLQFWILLKRTFRIILRDKHLTRMRFLAHIVIGMILGSMFHGIGNDAAKVQSNAGCLFFIAMFNIFSGMMPTILTFPLEMSVFVREHLNYWYSMKSYYFAKTVADIPFQVVMTLGYVVGVYYLTSQPMEWERFGMVIIVAILTSLVGQSYGLLVGAAFDITNGVFLGPISAIPMVLFSGFFCNLNDLPTYMHWLSYGSFLRYSFEGTVVAIYGLDRPKLECRSEYCHFKYPKEFLKSLAIEGTMETFIMDVSILFAMFIGLRIATYFFLKIKLMKNR